LVAEGLFEVLLMLLLLVDLGFERMLAVSLERLHELLIEVSLAPSENESSAGCNELSLNVYILDRYLVTIAG
jgi:hypothetical protein